MPSRIPPRRPSGRSAAPAAIDEVRRRWVRTAAGLGAAGLGLALVPEGRRLFADMTVRENLLLAQEHRGERRDGPPAWTLARVVQVFGAAHPHHAYLFANARANRMKVLVHDGFGVWLAARRLNQGKFVWGDERLGPRLTLSAEQLQALVTGLPWQRLGQDAVITVL